MTAYSKILRQLELTGLVIKENIFSENSLDFFKEICGLLKFNEIVYSFISGEVGSKRYNIFALNDEIICFYGKDEFSKKTFKFTKIKNIMIQYIETIEKYELTINFYDEPPLVIIDNFLESFIHFKKFIETEIYKIQREFNYDNLINKNAIEVIRNHNNIENDLDSQDITFLKNDKKSNFFDYFVSIKTVSFAPKLIYTILTLSIVSLVFTSFNFFDLLINGITKLDNTKANYFAFLKVDVFVFIINLILSTIIFTLNLFFFFWVKNKKNKVLKNLFLLSSLLTTSNLLLWITILSFVFTQTIDWNNIDSLVKSPFVFEKKLDSSISPLILETKMLYIVFFITFVLLLLNVCAFSTIVVIFIGIVDKTKNSYSKITKGE